MRDRDAMEIEELWIPVDETGSRWAARSLEDAEECRSSWPVGGTYPGGDRYPGITHLIRKRRYVTEWVEVGHE